MENKPVTDAGDWRWVQFENALTLRSTEDSTLWSIFGHFWAANAVFLVALFASGKAAKPPWGIVVCTVGAFVSIVWWLIQARALYHIERSEGTLRLLEDQLNLPEDLRLWAAGGQNVQGGSWFDVVRPSFMRGPEPLLRARTLMQLCSVAVGGAWLIGLAFAIFTHPGASRESGSSTMNLNASQTVFMLFFAIFWGALANVHPRWKAFQFPLCRSVKPQVWNRCVLAILLLNVVPVGYFLLMMWILGKAASGTTTWRYLMVGIVPAFGVFGIYRFWLAAIEKWPDTFYKARRVRDNGESSATDVLEREYWHVEPIYRKEYKEPSDPRGPDDDPSLPVIYLGTDRGFANSIAGIFYLVVGVVMPIVLLPR